jgi:hypothetical protein
MKQMQMTGAQLTEIGQTIFGKSWKSDIASHLNLSAQRIYQLSKQDKISEAVTEKVVKIHDDWKTSGGVSAHVLSVEVTTKDEEKHLSDEQILGRINKRFGIMNRMVKGMLDGAVRSMIVFGAPGIGKTYDIEQALMKAETESNLYFNILKGTCSAPGLYQTLYHARHGGIVVLDDCDSIFADEQAFNILKSALDSTGKRIISWNKLSKWVYDAANVSEDDIGEDDIRVPNKFEFEGGVIFITNVDFMEKAEKESRNSPHFKALLSRSLYLDLTLKSQRSRIIRVRDVFMNSMRKAENFTVAQGEEVLNYVLENSDRLREFSLRSMKLICSLFKMGSDWKDTVEFTMMKYPKID